MSTWQCSGAQTFMTIKANLTWRGFEERSFFGLRLFRRRRHFAPRSSVRLRHIPRGLHFDPIEREDGVKSNALTFAFTITRSFLFAIFLQFQDRWSFTRYRNKSSLRTSGQCPINNYVRAMIKIYCPLFVILSTTALTSRKKENLKTRYTAMSKARSYNEVEYPPRGNTSRRAKWIWKMGNFPLSR